MRPSFELVTLTIEIDLPFYQSLPNGHGLDHLINSFFEAARSSLDPLRFLLEDFDLVIPELVVSLELLSVSLLSLLTSVLLHHVDSIKKLLSF